MNPMQQLGLMLLVAGVLLALAGAVFFFGGKLGFGQLPGDVRFGGERWSCFVPITTMILISLVLTIVVNLLARWLK